MEIFLAGNDEPPVVFFSRLWDAFSAPATLPVPQDLYLGYGRWMSHSCYNPQGILPPLAIRECMMQVDIRKADDVIIVDLQGRLVSGMGNRILHDVMNQLIAEGWKMILLNLSGVSWIDSAGIGELVASLKLAKRFGISVKLLRIGDRVKHVLSISQILPLLDVYEDEEAALQELRATAGVPPPSQ